jgi:hypothetical protein
LVEQDFLEQDLFEEHDLLEWDLECLLECDLRRWEWLVGIMCGW